MQSATNGPRSPPKGKRGVFDMVAVDLPPAMEAVWLALRDVPAGHVQELLRASALSEREISHFAERVSEYEEAVRNAKVKLLSALDRAVAACVATRPAVALPVIDDLLAKIEGIASTPDEEPALAEHCRAALDAAKTPAVRAKLKPLVEQMQAIEQDSWSTIASTVDRFSVLRADLDPDAREIVAVAKSKGDVDAFFASLAQT